MEHILKHANIGFIIFQVVCYVTGILSILYFVQLATYIGLGNVFYYVWLILGLGLILLGGGTLILKVRHITIPRSICVLFLGVCIAVVLLFSVVEGLIIKEINTEPKQDADYLIVLGAKVNNTKPSLTLQYRIDAAAEYLKNSPETIVIVSGGKGLDEGISEAQAMANGLMEQGINRERIILEDQSTNTRENMKYSVKLMEEGKKVVVTTSGFHVLRAKKLMEREYSGEVSGLPAKSYSLTRITDYTRECLAVLKDGVLWK